MSLTVPSRNQLRAHPATPSPAEPTPLTLQLISGKESSKAVFQGDDRPPKPAGGTGYHKPRETEWGWGGAARAQARLRPGHLGPRDASWPGGGDEHLGPAARCPRESDTTSP